MVYTTKYHGDVAYGKKHLDRTSLHLLKVNKDGEANRDIYADAYPGKNAEMQTLIETDVDSNEAADPQDGDVDHESWSASLCWGSAIMPVTTRQSTQLTRSLRR